MKKNINALFVLFITLIFISCTKEPITEDGVTVDFTMAERTADWLEFITTGADDAAVRTYFTEKVAPTGGCQAIIHHWARFREWNESIFYDFIMEALGRIPSDQAEKNEDGSMSWFGRRKMLWQAALADPGWLRKEIKALKQVELKQAALRMAKAYLPAEAEVSNDFYIVVFGHSTAFSVGKENGFDLLQLPKTSDGRIDVDMVVSTFAHEMHHSGFSYCGETFTPQLKGDENVFLFGILAAEGMPTYFINKPFDHLDLLRSSPEPLYQALAKEWEAHLKHMSQLYEKAEKDILLNLEGRIGQDEVFRYWMGGIQGPAYALGSDMFRVIETNLGIEAAKSVPKDIRQFLDLYNRAAMKGNEDGGQNYVFSDELVRKAVNYGENE